MTRAVTPHRERTLSSGARLRPVVGRILGPPCGRTAQSRRLATRAGARRRRYEHGTFGAISRRAGR